MSVETIPRDTHPAKTGEQSPADDTAPEMQVRHGEDAVIHENLDEAYSEIGGTDPNEGYSESGENYTESSAREVLGNTRELQEHADQEVSLRVRALNGKDHIQRHATLQTARQWRLQSRAGRLERKLVNARPGSHRYKRLKSALTRTEYQMGKVTTARDKIFDRMYARNANDEARILEIAQKERRISEFFINRKVKIEKKRQEKIKDRAGRLKDRPEHRAERERLEQEMKEWPTMEKFEEELMAVVEKKFNARIGKGTA